MKHRNQTILLFIIGVCSLWTCQNDKEKQDRPNIILINVDDLGWKDVGYMGSQYYETPHIDQLASEGMIFQQAYAAAANCAPSRACILSGVNTPRHGVYTVDTSERGKSEDRKIIPIQNKSTIDEDFLLFPELLKDSGYTSCHAGKWHVTENPINQGFDINIGGSKAGNPGSYYPPYKNVPSLNSAKDEYLTDLIMDRTLDFVEENYRDPFFLYYSPYAVHSPIQPAYKLLEKYKIKPIFGDQNNSAYATMIENLDLNIGRLVALLKEKKVFENTFIFFTSDNGGVYRITSQKPLRAGKGSYYEGGIRVPAFAVWKGKIGEGEIQKTPISNLDIFPTLLELAHIEKPAEKILDGVSLLSLLTKKENVKPRSLFWHFPIYLEGGNVECQDSLFRTRPGSAIRDGNWKLIQYFENNDIELYNLSEDISEQYNLVKEQPEKATELLSILDSWRKKTNAPIPSKINTDYRE